MQRPIAHKFDRREKKKESRRGDEIKFSEVLIGLRWAVTAESVELRAPRPVEIVSRILSREETKK